MKWITWLVGWIVAVILSGGCSSNAAGRDLTFEQKQARLESTLKALEQANFVGEVELDHAGTPLKAGIKQEVYLGSDSSKLRVLGKVDFTQPPRTAPAAATP